MTNPGFLTWDDARPIVNRYFNFWPDSEDVTWIKKLWPYIEQSGLTVFHSDHMEMKCRSIPGCLGLFYQELIARTGVESKRNLDEKHYDELFENGIEEVESILFEIRTVLLNAIGKQLLFEWRKCHMIVGESRQEF